MIMVMQITELRLTISDYGHNDGDRNWKHKDEARDLFFDFFGIKASDPRRGHKYCATAVFAH